MTQEAGSFNGFTHIERHPSDSPSVPGELVETGTPRIRIDMDALSQWRAAVPHIVYVAETERAESASSSE